MLQQQPPFFNNKILRLKIQKLENCFSGNSNQILKNFIQQQQLVSLKLEMKQLWRGIKDALKSKIGTMMQLKFDATHDLSFFQVPESAARWLHWSTMVPESACSVWNEAKINYVKQNETFFSRYISWSVEFVRLTGDEHPYRPPG